MIFAVDHPLCDVWNQKKTQILIEFLDGTKKIQLAAKKRFLVAKKIPLGFRGFPTSFLLLTTPYVMFERKKNQIHIAHQKQTIDWTKKGRLAAKKSSARN